MRRTNISIQVFLDMIGAFRDHDEFVRNTLGVRKHLNCLGASLGFIHVHANEASSESKAKLMSVKNSAIA